MEHILQFGISIDEDKIIKTMEQNATQKAFELIKSNIAAFTKNNWGDSKLDRIFTGEVKEVVKAHENEIIEKAVEQLTKNMMRQKVVKEAMNKVVEEHK